MYIYSFSYSAKSLVNTAKTTLTVSASPTTLPYIPNLCSIFEDPNFYKFLTTPPMKHRSTVHASCVKI